MEYRRITLDAHTLIWYYHVESNIKLSQKALATILETEEKGIIYVPTVVLMEVLRLLEKGKYPIVFDDFLKDIEDNQSYKIIPLTTEIVKVVKNSQGRDLHDRVIIATALITDSILVSKDKEITATGINVIWSKNPDESIR